MQGGEVGKAEMEQLVFGKFVENTLDNSFFSVREARGQHERRMAPRLGKDRVYLIGRFHK